MIRCDEQGPNKITYQRKLAERIYVAELHVGTMTKQVVVKFAHSYNQEAHLACQAAGCAPKLYFVGQVLFSAT